MSPSVRKGASGSREDCIHDGDVDYGSSSYQKEEKWSQLLIKLNAQSAHIGTLRPFRNREKKVSQFNCIFI